MVCLRNICINTLHKGDNDDDNNNNNNNNELMQLLWCVTGGNVHALGRYR
jgi:hypothetical protein